MVFTNPTIFKFKSYFVRDFPYGFTTDTVMDQDVTNAINQAAININAGLFSSQEQYNLAFLFLSAHYLVTALRASSQGISGQFNWSTQSKGVGSVNESYAIPQRILNNPYLNALTRTSYGAQYVMMIYPKLSGAVYTVAGDTLA